MSLTNLSAARYATIDDLDRAIVGLTARLNAASHDLLVLIRRFDERAGWLKWGFDTCAEWPHWRCDLSLSAAREKVRVAHALKTLPAIGQAFARGRLSYSKVRALTRVADRSNEDVLLEFALHTTAVRVEARCRELRCGTEASIDEVNRAYARRGLRMHRDPHRGIVTLTIELPLEIGELIDKALDRARDDAASTAEGAEFAEESWSARQADALVTMAKSYLAHGPGDAAGGGAEHYRVTVHVDRSALVEGRGRSGLPVDSVRRLACDSETVVIVEDTDGEPLNVGRKTRTVPRGIKRALWARDKGCRFPGCTRRRFVDAHHIRHWSTGGETRLDNLLLLCSAHHRLVHEGGFRIEKDYRDRWYFKRPDGRAVPACGYRPDDMIDDDIDAGPEFLPANPSAEGWTTGLPLPAVP